MGMKDYLDNNGVRYLWTKIKNIFVQKESGKSLSTNDFTTAYKNKLDGIASGANKYTLPTATASVLGGVKVGSGLTISGGVLSASGGGELKVQRFSFDTGTTNGGSYVIEVPLRILYVALGSNESTVLCNESFTWTIEYYYFYNNVKQYTIPINVKQNTMEYELPYLEPMDRGEHMPPLHPTFLIKSIDLIIFGYDL